MMTSELEREAQQAITLIKSFSLELEQYSPESQVLYWLNQYRAAWIRDAIIEAVYQGRYKVISVEHILSIWQRRGQPVCHFTSGFEQVIAAQLGTPLHLSPSMMSHAKQPVEKFGHGDVSPLQVSTEDIPIASRVVVEADVINGGNYPGLSIDAFPVEAKNTLVELYQANVPHKHLADDPSKALKTSKPRYKKTLYSSRYVSLSKSSPIQPFKPEPRPKHLSRR